MCDIDHAFWFCTESKMTKWQKLRIVLELDEFFLWRPRNEAFLHSTRTDLERGFEKRMERKNSLVCSEGNMTQDESFEVRKQHLLTSYFGLISIEELKNDFANYQHTSTSSVLQS